MRSLIEVAAVVVLGGGVAAVLGPGQGRFRFPFATVVALVVVGVPSALQLTVLPGLLPLLERDRTEIGAGELWRVATALVVQDGGDAGAVVNLVALAVVGAVAEQRWSRTRWVAIAVAGALAGEVWGLVVQPVGGGDSIAVFGLAGSLAASALRRRVSGRRPPAILAVAAGLLLLVLGDIHGAAAAVGSILGLLLRPLEEDEGAVASSHPAPPAPARRR